MTTKQNFQTQKSEENATTNNDRQEASFLKYNVRKVKLDDYGFEEAGVNKGNAEALTNFLNEIKEGHVVDVNQSAQELSNQRKLIEDNLDAKKGEHITQLGAGEQLEKYTIPEKEAEIREKQGEIKQLELDKINGKSGCQTDTLMLWMWGALSVLLGIYLVMFYASAIHSVFFRDLLQELVKTGNTQNLSQKLNSIFDPNALFKVSASTLYIYFGSTLFFAFGLLAHHYLNKPMKFVDKILIGAIAMLVPFIADALLAFKIHNNIQTAKALMGIGDLTEWYKSMNFWLVIVFGYLAYMAWALIFQLFHAERSRRNPIHSANFSIEILKKEIKTLREEIRRHRVELSEIRIAIERLNQEIQRIIKRLEKALRDPDLLQHSLHQFFGGWLRYINAGNQNLQRKECTELFDKFINENFNQPENSTEIMLTHKN